MRHLKQCPTRPCIAVTLPAMMVGWLRDIWLVLVMNFLSGGPAQPVAEQVERFQSLLYVQAEIAQRSAVMLSHQSTFQAQFDPSPAVLTYWSLNEVARDLEDAFLYDPNDAPLARLQARGRRAGEDEQARERCSLA